MQYIPFCIGVILLVVYLSKRTFEVRLPVVLLKSVVSLSFIVFAVFSGIFNNSLPLTSTALFVCGGVCGLLGDIYLDFKYLYKEHSDTYLYSGFVSFSIGHVFYTLAMLQMYPAGVPNYLFAVFGGFIVVGAIPVTEKLMGISFGKFKKITAVYSFILGFTTGLSFTFIISETPDIHRVMLHVAFMFFLLSDALLSSIYFSKKEKDRKSRPMIVLNHLFYYIAQFMIALTLNFYRG